MRVWVIVQILGLIWDFLAAGRPLPFLKLLDFGGNGDARLLLPKFVFDLRLDVLCLVDRRGGLVVLLALSLLHDRGCGLRLLGDDS